jgi:hypothetical protein
MVVVYKTRDPGVYAYFNGSIKGNSVTVDYYNSFPLKTKKASAFSRWCEIRSILLAKEHLSPEGIERIRKGRPGGPALNQSLPILQNTPLRGLF